MSIAYNIIEKGQMAQIPEFDPFIPLSNPEERPPFYSYGLDRNHEVRPPRKREVGEFDGQVEVIRTPEGKELQGRSWLDTEPTRVNK